MYTIEEFDENKTRVLKYVLFKKRTKQEIKNKFANLIEGEMLNDIIDELEENGYINDKEYIRRTINDFIALNNLSIKEIKYKLYSKGVSENLIDDYISSNGEELVEYELESAKKIAIKKSKGMEIEDIKRFLLKKGYMGESVKYAINNLEEGVNE